MDLELPTGPPHSTLGIVFIGLALSCLIYGVTCLQALRYFRLHCSEDSWILKAAVIVVWMVETINTGFSVRAMEYYVIQNRGNFSVVWTVPWTIGIQSSLNTFAGSIIQFFFAWRIFIMSEKNHRYTAFIIAISLAQFGMGTAVTVIGLGNYPKLHMKFIDAILAPAFALTASADIIICISLCYYLQKRKTGHDVTNRLVNNLTVMTINNGIMSSGFALLALVALYAWPTSQLSTACCFLHGKAYTNTLFANLNSRLKSRDRLVTHTYSSPTTSGGQQLHSMEFSLGQFRSLHTHTHSVSASADNSDVILVSREPYAEPRTPHFDEMVPLQNDSRRI